MGAQSEGARVRVRVCGCVCVGARVQGVRVAYHTHALNILCPSPSHHLSTSLPKGGWFPIHNAVNYTNNIAFTYILQYLKEKDSTKHSMMLEYLDREVIAQPPKAHLRIDILKDYLNEHKSKYNNDNGDNYNNNGDNNNNNDNIIDAFGVLG